METRELFAFEELNFVAPLAIRVLAVEPAGPPPITITSVSLGIVLVTIANTSKNKGLGTEFKPNRPPLAALSGVLTVKTMVVLTTNAVFAEISEKRPENSSGVYLTSPNVEQLSSAAQGSEFVRRFYRPESRKRSIAAKKALCEGATARVRSRWVGC